MIAARTLLLVSTLLLLTPAYSQKPRLPRPLPAPSVFPSGSVVEYQWDLDCIETGTDTRLVCLTRRIKLSRVQHMLLFFLLSLLPLQDSIPSMPGALHRLPAKLHGV
jgi:hypothetical protein